MDIEDGATPNKKTKTLLYPVKVGDTLSRIGSRFGIKASFKRTVIGPSAFKSFAKMGFLSLV